MIKKCWLNVFQFFIQLIFTQAHKLKKNSKMTLDSVPNETNSARKFKNNIFWQLTSTSKYTPEQCAKDFVNLSFKSKIYLVIRLFDIYESEKYCHFAKSLAPLSCNIFCGALKRLVNSAHKIEVLKNFCDTMVSQCERCILLAGLGQDLWERENVLSDDQNDPQNYSSIEIKHTPSENCNWKINTDESFDLRYSREVLRFAFDRVLTTCHKLHMPDEYTLLKQNRRFENSIIQYSPWSPLRFDHLKKSDLPSLSTCGLTSVTTILKNSNFFVEPDDDDWYSTYAIADHKENSRLILSKEPKDHKELIIRDWFKNYSELMKVFNIESETQEVCGLCEKGFRRRFTKTKFRQYFVIHEAREKGECHEVYHKDCLLTWVIFHNAYLVHYNGHHPLTRHQRTFHVSYPCPSCKNIGHLLTEPSKDWNINNWAACEKQDEDSFVSDKKLDNQKVYGISFQR